MKNKEKNDREYRPYEDQQADCDHEWEMLDLGVGDYGSYYCPKCNIFKRDWEREQD